MESEAQEVPWTMKPSEEAQKPSEGSSVRINSPDGEIKNLRQSLEEKTKLADSYLDQLLRLKAEFENYRKRIEQERPQWIRMGKIECLFQILVLYDAWEKGRKQLNTVKETEQWKVGLEVLQKEFEKFFQSLQVEPIPSVGKVFDPMIHEVVDAVTMNETEEGTIIEEIQRGYLLEGRLLRSAKVRISKKMEVNKNG